MRWLDKMSENIRRGLRSWLNIQPAGPVAVQIQEIMDLSCLQSVTGSGTVATGTNWSSYISRVRRSWTGINFGRADAHKAWRCGRSIPDFRD